MAIKIYEKFAPRANPADGDYPNGSIKNESVPGAKDGTPLDAEWGNDYAGFDAALLAEAGITPSGNPDTAVASQRLEAIKKMTDRRAATVTQVESGTFGDGSRLTLTDRGDSPFNVVVGGTPNGIDIIDAGNGNTAVLSMETTPTSQSLGITETSDPTFNATAMQRAVNDLGGIVVTTGFTYDQQLLLPFGGANIQAIGGNKTITWTGSSLVYAMTPADSGGSYSNNIEGVTLRGASDKLLFDAARVRFSTFKDFNMLGGAVCCRIRSSWNTRWYNCAFRNETKTAGSKAIYFEYDALEPFNVVNTAVFEGCYFAQSDGGVVIETGGDGILFSNARIEGNNDGVVFQGKGVSHGIVFNNGCYIEGNTHASILWNKTGAGNMYGVVFENNYFGTEDTARAGIIEFVASNGGGHSLKFVNNTMRDFGGLPTQNVLLDVNGATMSDIFIDWYGNGKGAGIPSFDKNAIDWRYIRTDVKLKLNYITNPSSGNPFAPAYANGGIYVAVADFGIAEIFGTFTDATNAFGGALNITEAMPSTLRPAALEKTAGITINDSNSEGIVKTVILNGGVVRSINVGSLPISFSHKYNMNVSKQSFIV